MMEEVNMHKYIFDKLHVNKIVDEITYFYLLLTTTNCIHIA